MTFTNCVQNNNLQKLPIPLSCSSPALYPAKAKNICVCPNTHDRLQGPSYASGITQPTTRLSGQVSVLRQVSVKSQVKCSEFGLLQEKHIYPIHCLCLQNNYFVLIIQQLIIWHSRYSFHKYSKKSHYGSKIQKSAKITYCRNL